MGLRHGSVPLNSGNLPLFWGRQEGDVANHGKRELNYIQLIERHVYGCYRGSCSHEGLIWVQSKHPVVRNFSRHDDLKQPSCLLRCRHRGAYSRSPISKSISGLLTRPHSLNKSKSYISNFYYERLKL